MLENKGVGAEWQLNSNAIRSNRNDGPSFGIVLPDNLQLTRRCH